MKSVVLIRNSLFGMTPQSQIIPVKKIDNPMGEQWQNRSRDKINVAKAGRYESCRTQLAKAN